MQYRLDKYGNELSVLGFGCLRFPQKNGKIDMEATGQQIRLAVEAGVNYFDTAYVYPGSEAALGEILESEGLRQRVKIATKLPHYLIKSPQGLEKMFREELKRLRTDHVEYYLMHMLCDLDTWERLKKLGMEEWIAEKKASGQIGQIGFPTTAAPRCSASWWMPMTGISARFNTIIWMKIPRRAAGDFTMLRPRVCRSSSWSRCGAANW